MNEVEDGCSNCCCTTDTKAKHHVANLGNDVERQDSFHVVLRNGTQDTDCHCRHTNDHHQIAELSREQQRLHTNEAVHANLGEQARKHGACRAWCCWIRVGQPGKEREHCGLNAKGNEQQQVKPHPDTIWQRGNSLGQLGEIHCSCCCKNQSHCHHQHNRLDDVEHHICGSRSNLLFVSFKREQHITCHEQHFESDKQVEQVAGEEGLRDTRNERHIHRVVVRRVFVRCLLANCKQQYRGGHHKCDHN